MIDPRISLAVRAPDVAPAINIFENALMNAQTRDLRSAQEARRAELAPLQLQQAQQQAQVGQSALDEQSQNRILRSVAEFGTKLKPVIQSGNIDQAQTMLANRVVELQSQGLPTTETVEAITALRSGDSQGVVNAIDSIQTIARQRGLTGVSQVSVGQREFENKVAAVKADPNLETAEGKAAAISLGLEAKASTSAKERIATDPELTTAIATSQAEIEGATAEAKEEAKLTQQLKHKPEINKAVKLAEKESLEKGEVLTDFKRSKAALPGLLSAVDELRELATIATSTFGGKLFDGAVKQTGFGSTKGATARAKFIAIINNQVLPLLKPTFGGSFTVQEGESLKATMGDPDASPEEKMVQLDAFITQKQRDIETKQAQLDQPAPVETGINEFAGFKVVR